MQKQNDKEYKKAYYKKNKVHIIAKTSLWAKDNSENRKVISKRYASKLRKKNPEKVRLRLKSFKSHIQRMYSGMKRRISGKGTKNPYLYLGLEICTKEEFYIFAEENDAYKVLHKNWMISDYDRRLTPSVNRINTKYGYTLTNIEFITASENSSLGALSKHYGGYIR